MKKCVIIVPTYNERGNIASLVKALSGIKSKLSTYDLHLLFVDDNSPDGTEAEIIKSMKKYPFVHLFRNKRKGGLGHAYKVGMQYALDKLKADYLFEFDADLSHDPAKIPAFLTKLDQGADIVLGSRYIKNGGIPPKWGFHRKFLSIIGNLFIRTIMLNFRVHDWTTGFRGINQRVAKQIIPQLNARQFQGYTWQIGFLHKAVQAGFTIAEVPFIFIDRTVGDSKLGPEYIFNNLLYLMKVRFKDLLHSRIIKFIMVGGLGSLVQLVALHYYRRFLGGGFWILSQYQTSLILAIETAILSNFTWSNLWTFRDRKLLAKDIPLKYLQFNLTSGGSILIQFFLATVGEKFFGLVTIFSTNVFGRGVSLDTGMLYAVLGILVGMFWNFFAYNKFIWKKAKS